MPSIWTHPPKVEKGPRGPSDEYPDAASTAVPSARQAAARSSSDASSEGKTASSTLTGAGAGDLSRGTCFVPPPRSKWCKAHGASFSMHGRHLLGAHMATCACCRNECPVCDHVSGRDMLDRTARHDARSDSDAGSQPELTAVPSARHGSDGAGPLSINVAPKWLAATALRDSSKSAVRAMHEADRARGARGTFRCQHVTHGSEACVEIACEAAIDKGHHLCQQHWDRRMFVLEYGEQGVDRAITNFSKFYKLDSGKISIEDVEATTAGLVGWGSIDELEDDQLPEEVCMLMDDVPEGGACWLSRLKCPGGHGRSAVCERCSCKCGPANEGPKFTQPMTAQKSSARRRRAGEKIREPSVCPRLVEEAYTQTTAHLPPDVRSTMGVFVNAETRQAWMKAIRGAKSSIWAMSFTFCARDLAEELVIAAAAPRR